MVRERVFSMKMVRKIFVKQTIIYIFPAYQCEKVAHNAISLTSNVLVTFLLEINGGYQRILHTRMIKDYHLS